ncbi:MAG: Rad52/Rad22 family DNA repair protein [Methyloceanibacter sp.]|nr:Rad52/Rad22 family DNA repair protein [Methyloceanibacter sp.]
MTGFSDTQTRQLRAKLDEKHIRHREAQGATLHYLEGWHVIAEANRIFGFASWDRRTLQNTCLWSGTAEAAVGAAYTATVRISVRAGDITVVRDGSGYGEGKAKTRGQAHDVALKAAETDATKRALATFGNAFGLALYDPERRGVRRAKTRERQKPYPQSWSLRSARGGTMGRFDKPNAFIEALRNAMTKAPDIESLFALWEANVDEVRLLNRVLRQDHLTKSGIAPQLVEHLKRCAVALAAPPGVASDGNTAPKSKLGNGGGRPKIDKSALSIGAPKRIRSKEHLKFVASQPCVICGRKPCHAHHLRHAQSRGLSLKVSDEFTVPLCAIHHNGVHRFGKEETWWRERNLDPLSIARSLWEESQGRHAKREGPNGSEPSPPGTDRSRTASEGTQEKKV